MNKWNLPTDVKAAYIPHELTFKFPAGTSRGVLKQKKSGFICLKNKAGDLGIGELSTIPKLSVDDRPDYDDFVSQVVKSINEHHEADVNIEEWPSVVFALETAILDLKNGGKRLLFDTSFTCGTAAIPINGLIWMGSKANMLEQVGAKIEAGFRCIKMKIGAIDFEEECAILAHIRQHFSPEEIEIRVDANGAFAPEKALQQLERLSTFHLHSIEQPVNPRHKQALADLVQKSPIPIALDESLIGITNEQEQKALLAQIKPNFIILKPALLGGFKATEQWVKWAENTGIGWWVTSALEGNIGLNAIAQWTSSLNTSRPQGLGTGQLFTNNIPAPLHIEKGYLYHDQSQPWDLSPLPLAEVFENVP